MPMSMKPCATKKHNLCCLTRNQTENQKTVWKRCCSRVPAQYKGKSAEHAWERRRDTLGLCDRTNNLPTSTHTEDIRRKHFLMKKQQVLETNFIDNSALCKQWQCSHPKLKSSETQTILIETICPDLLDISSQTQLHNSLTTAMQTCHTLLAGPNSSQRKKTSGCQLNAVSNV